LGFEVFAVFVAEVEDDVGAAIFFIGGFYSDELDIALVFFDKFACGGKRYLVEVFVDFFGGHADAAIADGEGAFGFVDEDVDGEIAQFFVVGSAHGERLQFGRCVDGVGDEFAQKDFMLGIEKFLDDGEYIFGLYGDVALFDGIHSAVFFHSAFQKLFQCCICAKLAGRSAKGCHKGAREW